MNNKPYSPACDRNKDHILKHLVKILNDSKTVLEIGSGTGQHAVYFAEHIPYIVWQTSDLLENHQGIINWIKDSNIKNVYPPFILDVANCKGISNYDAVFTANTFHIMSWENVQSCIKVASKALLKHGPFIIYGPFSIDNKYTSKSNEEFDLMLRQKNEEMGIRELSDVTKVCNNNNFKLREVIDMPANNLMLYFEKF